MKESEIKKNDCDVPEDYDVFEVEEEYLSCVIGSTTVM